MNATAVDLQPSLKAIREGQHASRALELLFSRVRPDAATAAALRSSLYNAIRFPEQPGVLCVPDWLRGRLEQSLGDRYDTFVTSSATDAPVVIRVNTLRTSVEACMRALAPYHPSTLGDLAIEIGRPFGLFASTAFHDGWFEQQDVTSQRVARVTGVTPGMRVVDACAGAGGKTLAMAAMMQNRGRLIALDVAALKLEACRQRTRRAGATCVETRHITTTKVVKRLYDTADCVLIDAPCSGTGVLRRNPDILWHLTEQHVEELRDTQREILQRYSRMVRRGGKVVYATCSVLREEGPQQVEEFLLATPDFSLTESWQTLPGDHGGDGFYVAILTRQ